MRRCLAIIIGSLGLLALASGTPAKAACARWVPEHLAGGHWAPPGVWVPPRWVAPRCVAFVAPPPPVVVPLPAVAPYWRPWRRPYYW